MQPASHVTTYLLVQQQVEPVCERLLLFQLLLPALQALTYCQHVAWAAGRVLPCRFSAHAVRLPGCDCCCHLAVDVLALLQGSHNTQTVAEGRVECCTASASPPWALSAGQLGTCMCPSTARAGGSNHHSRHTLSSQTKQPSKQPKASSQAPCY